MPDQIAAIEEIEEIDNSKEQADDSEISPEVKQSDDNENSKEQEFFSAVSSDAKTPDN